MAFPTTSVLDNFNRASIGANWSANPFNAGGANLITASSLYAGHSSTYAEAWYNATSFAGDCEAFCTLQTRGTNGATFGMWVGLIRQPSASSSTADGYQAELLFGTTNDSVAIWRYTNSVQTKIAGSTNLAARMASGDKIGLEVKGGTIQLYTYQSGAWASRLSVADSTYSFSGDTVYGELAFYNSATNAQVDDFAAGSVVGGGGSQTVTATGIASAGAFGTTVVSPGSRTLSPSAVSSAGAFGTAVVSPGSRTLSPSAVATAAAFGTAVFSTGATTLSPSAVSSAEQVRSPTINPGSVTLTASGVGTGVEWGAATITPGPVTTTTTGIGTAGAFGTATMQVGSRTISPSAIATSEGYGQPSLDGGEVSDVSLLMRPLAGVGL